MRIFADENLMCSTLFGYRTKAESIGIEYDEHIYEDALENSRTAHPRAKADFILTRANA